MASQKKTAFLSPFSWPCFFSFLLLLQGSGVLPLAAVDVDDDGIEASTALDRKAYVVYMGELPKDISAADVEASHRDMLDSVVGSQASSTRILHSYKRSFNGFSAMLSEEEAKTISASEGVVSIFPSQNRKLHTTRSWDFVNLPLGAARVPSAESDVIVGMIDTGISTESKSFDDTGYGPPPGKWKGTCQTSSNFTCNNKVIGARFYHTTTKQEGDVESPLDTIGHGTHTASTAAGRQVVGADLYGLAKGTARGGVPGARIAAYKVCWIDGCGEADILKAFDDAIADGVDILSVSLGGPPGDLFNNAVAVGSFHAMKRGILTSNSAGNNGPVLFSLENIAPWTITVAANTIDRRFVTDAKLGNGDTFEGLSINTFDLGDKMLPLIYAGDASSDGSTASIAQPCIAGALNPELVKGKILLCELEFSGDDLFTAGAAGVISQETDSDVATSYPLPATALLPHNVGAVHSYVNQTRDPTATISKSRESSDANAPYVVSFSSRGPGLISGLKYHILKPDLTAPGVEILAAWSPSAAVSESDVDTRRAPYNIISGTSMSCPHVTGAAAYVKSFHPAWSPAAIKSALMTTATPMRPSSNPDAELAYGAGQINPVAAVKPGLVYDMGEEDYVSMLCRAGYDTGKLRKITGDDSACAAGKTNGTVGDLNYPSFTLPTMTAGGSAGTKATYRRTVTNVGSPSSVYRVTVDSPSEHLRVDVDPKVLSFRRLQEKQSFTVEVTVVDPRAAPSIISASLSWSDGVYQVRSPILAYAAVDQ